MKRQTRPLSQTGSFINNLMGNNTTTPVVGEMCTICGYSDRHVFEVIAVSEDGTACTVRRAKVSRTGNRDMSETQSYEYTSNPNGQTKKLVWKQRKGVNTGAWYVEYITVDFTAAIKRAAKERNLFVYSQALTEDQRLAVYGDSNMPANVVKGITSERKRYNDVSVVFGSADEYFDFSF